MKIKSESSYSDGHESVKFYEVADSEVPGDLLEVEPTYGDLNNLREFLFTYSGDGHGTDNDLGFFHIVTIVEASDPELVGEYIEVDG